MTIRVIRDNESLDSAWEELVFTEARLQGDANAQPFAPSIAVLLTKLELVRSGQLGVWREGVAAQAAVDAVDDRLDDWVRAFDTALQTAVKGNLQSARYRRYFNVAPHQIIRLGLESEIGRVQTWVDSLATEPEAALKELGAQLKSIIAEGNAALERRRRAAGSRADHRVREITSLVDDINGARSSLYGALLQKVTELGLPRDWPDRFFRHTARASRAQSPQTQAPAVATPAPVPQQPSNATPAGAQG